MSQRKHMRTDMADLHTRLERVTELSLNFPPDCCGNRELVLARDLSWHVVAFIPKIINWLGQGATDSRTNHW